MIRRKIGIAALALMSLPVFSGIAAARDWHDNRYENRSVYSNDYYGHLTARQRHELELRREREALEARRLREQEQRRSMQQRYTNGYYDRLGYWHSYGR